MYLWPLRVSAQWTPCPSTGPGSPDSSLAFWHKVSQAYVVHVQPQPWGQSFLQASLLPFGGKWCLKEHNHFKSPSPVEVKQTSSTHNYWSCCKVASLYWRFWPLAGPAGKDHGEKPRKTKPSCLRILPTEQLAKSWQVWGGVFLETCFLCTPSWYLWNK